MPRKVPEWIGKTDDEAAPPRVKTRILRKQGFKCAITHVKFAVGETPEFDHIIALINDGENRESNLQAIRGVAHKKKTKLDVAFKAQTDAMTKTAFNLNAPRQKFPQRPKPEPKPKRFDRTPLAPRVIFEDSRR